MKDLRRWFRPGLTSENVLPTGQSLSNSGSIADALFLVKKKKKTEEKEDSKWKAAKLK